jgi:excisionase family DNA binding protein
VNVETSSDELLTPREVAEIAGLCRDSVYRAVRRGDLRAHKLSAARNGMLRIQASDVARWIAANDRGRGE